MSDKETRLLVSVLSFDDLLRPPAGVLNLDQQPGPITIGRGGEDEPLGFPSPGELHVPDRFLSVKHASIEDNWIRDLESRNGTWVDGQRVSEAALGDGALIEVGHTLFCYRVVDAALADALQPDMRVGPMRTLNPELQAAMRELDGIVPSLAPILILGERGVGKEVLAERMHVLSGRRGELSTVDCAAVPDALFEATFFGHAQSTVARRGELSRAQGGTVFLDEVGSLGAAAQKKLLEGIERGSFTPLRGEPQKLDVRWIAATSQELDPKSGLFRHLAGHVVRLPPLRKRREDLGLLTAYILGKVGATRASISATAARALFSGKLDGNVRELRHALRTAHLLSAGDPIRLDHLQVYSGREEPETRKLAPDREELEAALMATGGNVVQAAKRLSTTGRQLCRWLEKHQINLSPYTL